jgi:serine/threonine protein kinase, bacterial
MNKIVSRLPFLPAAVFLFLGLVLPSCLQQPILPTATFAPLILPTVFPTESPTPVPTLSPLPTLLNIQSLDTPIVTSEAVLPEEFIRGYFSAINDRNYELAWTMLSTNFQATQTYAEYTSWWNTVDQVEIISLNIRSQDVYGVFIYVEANYIYKSGVVATGHTEYKLVQNETNHSWLFDPN